MRYDAPHTESTGTSGAVITQEQVYAVIADVLDPELDEPLVTLGFIDRVEVRGTDVTVTFKLPTYWCSPNFAYLMASDLRARVRTLPGVASVRIELLDHCAEEEITAGVNSGLSFAEAFADEAIDDKDLEELRQTFLRKGFLMRQDNLLRRMLKAGLDETTLLNLTLTDLVIDELADIAFVATPRGVVRLEGAGRMAAHYLRKRRAIGLSQAEDAPLMSDDKGQAIAPGGLQEFLRRSRSVRLNIMFNISLCKGLFRTRYEGAGASDAHREGDLV